MVMRVIMLVVGLWDGGVPVRIGSELL